MVNAPLACTVRGCGLALQHVDRVWKCSRGHSFDVARSGYVNLLQPQDRRSPIPGDSSASIDARARALAAGIGRSILNAFVERAAALPFGDGAAVVDLGCGSGDALAALAARRSMSGIGIDLSAAAIDAAARAHQGLTWVVANADRRLPLLDQRVALVLSLHARRNPAECARALEPRGHLLIAVPASDDLNELREAVQGTAVVRERGDALVDAHRDGFTLVERSVARERVEAGKAELLDLLHGTYRGIRFRDARITDELESMNLTLASEFFLFARR